MEKEKSTNFMQVDNIETVVSESKCYLQISKPDFLGGDKWEFKHDNIINIKISDEDWLNKFKNGDITIKPGDILEATLNLKKNYRSYSKHLRDFELSITKVIAIHDTPKLEYFVYESNFDVKEWKKLADSKNWNKQKIEVSVKAKTPEIKKSKPKSNGKRKK